LRHFYAPQLQYAKIPQLLRCFLNHRKQFFLFLYRSGTHRHRPVIIFYNCHKICVQPLNISHIDEKSVFIPDFHQMILIFPKFKHSALKINGAALFHPFLAHDHSISFPLVFPPDALFFTHFFTD